MYTVYQIWGQVFLSKGKTLGCLFKNSQPKCKDERIEGKSWADAGILQNEEKTTYCEFAFQAADEVNRDRRNEFLVVNEKPYFKSPQV